MNSIRSISSKIYLNLTIGPLTRNNYFLRFYTPPSLQTGKFTDAVISVFKHGVRQFDKIVKMPLDRFEQIRPGNKFSYIDIKLDTYKFDSTNNQAQLILEASERNSSVECWVTFITAESTSVLDNYSYEALAGETYRLKVNKPDVVLFGKENARLSSKRAVLLNSDLPSRNINALDGPSDADQKEDFIVSNKNDRNKNILSYYENKVSTTYYYLSNSLVRVYIGNIPPNFDKLQVECLKSGEFNWNSRSIKKIDEECVSELSSYFFSGVEGEARENGNGFTRSGGYIVFDLQVRVDLRNSISKRVNKEEQNFFSNQKAANGSLLENNNRSALPMFDIPNAFAGQRVKIRLRMSGAFGLERIVYSSDDISTFGFSAPRIKITSNSVIVPRIPNNPKAKLMTTYTINDSNVDSFTIDINSNGVSVANDIMLDLGVSIKDYNMPDGLQAIIDAYSNGGPVLGGRQGASFIVADIKRYDSYTGLTLPVGVFSTDKVIDQISNPDLSNSIASHMGVSNREQFVRKCKEHGLIILYKIQYYEITPELLAAYLSISEVNDNTSRRLFSNLSDNRFNRDVPLIEFLKNITNSKTPLQQASIQLEYSSVKIDKPSFEFEESYSYQGNTNVPYNKVLGICKGNSSNYAAFVEIERVYSDKAFNNNVTDVREYIGTLPIINNRFCLRDFIAKDMTNNMKNGAERPLDVYYLIYVYEYVLSNGLVSDKINKRLDPIVVRIL